MVPFCCCPKFIFAFLFSLLCASSFAQDKYLLQNKTIIHRLDKKVSVFIDTTSKLTINQITTPEFQKHFQTRGNLVFGYLKPDIWLKIETYNMAPGANWLLEIPAPFLEYVDFYQNHESTWKHTQSGYYRPQSVREISHTSHLLPLQFSSDSTSIVYIKISGRSPKTFPLFIVDKENFNEKTRYEDVGYGIFFGILIVMFFYNLLLYITLKQVNYLLYIGTIVCTFLIFSSASGYAGKFLWPEHPAFNFYAGRMSLSVMAIFLSIFTIRFLEVKKYSTVMYYALLALIPLAVIAAILIITKTLSSAGNNLISLATLVYMVTGIVCRIKGNKTASYFIAAWTVYLIGGLLLTLRNSGAFDYNFWTTHFVEIGAALETTIIAFALGSQYRRFKREKEVAQWHALKIQLGATEKLERKVNERTEQLSKALEELRATLETNLLQTKVIEKKNAELDSFFYRISHDLKGPIASLLGLSNLANLEVTDEKARLYFVKQQKQVERLNNIIIGLMKLTRLNHTDLQKEKIDFAKLVNECILSLNALDNFKKIDFKKSIQPDIEFHSEWILLNAILQNLIENAIKYASEESPYVEINIRSDLKHLTIEVKDNGQGIPDEHQPKIFEMFFRATQSATGSGLGLYILKRSVDRLQGNIDINSDEGVGSTFTVKLPVSIN
jgi:signal transduction histidine kinase